ncbi:MAG: DUF4136 domain-containing protein, partial [Candidatus Krumholzibacteria bacterium]|nr:DUF4136 domain-containing protein [Candidatus Krumholzibacteria bacterium]
PLGLLVPLGLLLLAGVYGACTPGSDITAAESDVVVTLFDNDFNFGSIKTYSMPDSIMMISADSLETSDMDHDTQKEIIDLVESNFTSRGYQRIDPAQSPDFNVVLTEQRVEHWNLYTYNPWNPWYGGWGYYWWYYPPSTGVSYAFTTGTLFIQMGEFEENPGDTGKTKTAYWYASMNGVLDDSQANLRRRFTDSINQAFDQSPYLKTK